MMSDHGELAALQPRSLKALVRDPAAQYAFECEGGIIREGHDPELDKLREDLSKNGKAFIARLEQQERTRSGIGSTASKVGFNSRCSATTWRVSKQHSEQACLPTAGLHPQADLRRTPGRLHLTAELKDHEALVLGAEEKSVALETDLFGRLRTRVAEHAKALLQTARALAEIDTLSTFAEVVTAKRARLRQAGDRRMRTSLLRESNPAGHPIVEANRT